MNTNTATISSNFPNTAEEFWSARPADVEPYSWLFHPLNPFRFERWVAKLLNKIGYYARRFNDGWTFFFQRTVAKWLGISEQWLRQILHRLKLIGWITDRKIRKNRQYRIVGYSLPYAPQLAVRGETFGENGSTSTATPAVTEEYSEPPPLYSEHQDQYSRSVDTIIITSDDVEADPIVQIFEESTGTRYRSNRDYTTLQEFRQCDPLAVEAGILETVLNATTQINSMRYCLPQVKSFVRALQVKPLVLTLKGVRQEPPLSRETLQVIIKARRIRLERLRARLITRDQLTIERTEEQRREMQLRIERDRL